MTIALSAFFNVDPTNAVFIGDIFGFILALPIALFLAYWLSAVKNHIAVVVGAFIGALLGFVILLSWAGTLITDTPPMPSASGGSVFFGSVLLCSIMGLVVGMTTDLLIARRHKRDYLRQSTESHEQS